MNKHFFYFIPLLLSLFFFQCSSEDQGPGPIRLGENHFPIESGDFREYVVEEITYSIFGDIDTVNYFLREEVGEAFDNLAGGTSYPINRFMRMNDSLPWEIEAVWTARKTLQEAISVEENVPFIKLAFPIEAGKIWDGNALNGNDEDEYEATLVEQAYTSISGEVIPNAITVLQNNNNDYVVSLDKRSEVYGLGIGMLFKESVLLNFCTTEACLIDPDTIISSGNIFRQSIISYGKN